MKVIVQIDMNEAIKAGKNEYGKRLVEVDVSQLSEEEREVLAKCKTDIYDDRQYYKSLTESVMVHGITVYPMQVAEATPETARAILRDLVQKYRKALLEHQKSEALRKEREEKEAAAERQKIEEVRKAFASEGLAGVRELLRGYDEYRWCEQRGITEVVNAIKKEKLEAEEQEQAKRKEIEKEMGNWIMANGSDRLKKAYRAGYPCFSAYAIERARMELGDEWIVDVRDAATWKSPKVYPSEEALDLEAELKAKGFEAEIVWLTHDGLERDYDDEPFEPCEAIVIRKYLGKYDAILKM